MLFGLYFFVFFLLYIYMNIKKILLFGIIYIWAIYSIAFAREEIWCEDANTSNKWNYQIKINEEFQEDKLISQNCECDDCGNCTKYHCVYTQNTNYINSYWNINIYKYKKKWQIYIWKTREIEKINIKFYHPPD